MEWYNQSVAVTANKFLNRGLGFLGVLYFANKLGAAPYGVYILFVSIASILGIFTDFGLRTAVEKRVSEGAEDILITTFFLKLFLFVLIAALVVLLSAQINDYFGRDIALYAIPAVLFSELGRVLLHKLSGELRIVERALTETVRNILFLIASVVLIHLGHNFISLVWGYLISWTLVSFWLLGRVSIGSLSPSLDVARSLYSFAKFNFVASFVSSQVNERMDVLIIGFFLTQFHVGVYQVAWQVTSLVVVMSTSIGKVIFPHISSLHTSESLKEIQSIVKNAFTGAVILSVPASLGLFLFRIELLTIVFPPEFVAASAALAVLLVGRISQSLNAVSGRLLLGINRPDLVAYSALVMVASNVVLNIVLVWQLGLVGAAAATSTALTINFLVALYFASSITAIRFDSPAIGVILGASIVMYWVLAALITWVTVTSIFILFLMVTLGAVVYAALILMYQPFRIRLLTTIRTIAL